MLASVMPATPSEQLCAKLAASLADGTFVRVVLSTPVNANEGPQKILGRCVMLKGVPHLSLTLRHATQDRTKNLPLAECAGWLRDSLEREFRSALLCTTVRDWQFISVEGGAARLVDHKPSSKTTPPRTHDRKRVGFLDASARDWLQGLGIMDAAGQVRASMADKYRQINHYLEILSHLAKECGWIETLVHDTEQTEALIPSATKQSLVFADMGCGKGYLTFGAWHLFHRVAKQPVRIMGVEARPDLVAATNKLARQINAEGLEFVAGSIQSARLPPLDALIALHACNTATDDAIRRGIELGAKLIIVAPCCHQELRPQLSPPEPLATVLRHGVMAERLAEWVTDGLRALVLEWAGYRTKVMEFVDAGHTPKNLMIAAVRESQPFQDQIIRQRIHDLKKSYGIEHHALDDLLKGA
jgi:SAM-dependent methyltransferase